MLFEDILKAYSRTFRVSSKVTAGELSPLFLTFVSYLPDTLYRLAVQDFGFLCF